MEFVDSSVQTQVSPRSWRQLGVGQRPHCQNGGRVKDAVLLVSRGRGFLVDNREFYGKYTTAADRVTLARDAKSSVSLRENVRFCGSNCREQVIVASPPTRVRPSHDSDAILLAKLQSAGNGWPEKGGTAPALQSQDWGPNRQLKRLRTRFSLIKETSHHPSPRKGQPPSGEHRGPLPREDPLPCATKLRNPSPQTYTSRTAHLCPGGLERPLSSFSGSYRQERSLRDWSSDSDPQHQPPNRWDLGKRRQGWGP